jgi:replicative DNA helicase
VTGVPTGYTELDKLLGGFQPSDLIILAARPGMGKTAFALNCAANAAKAGKNVVIFTLEMTKEQLMGRVLSSEAKVDSSRLSRGDLTEDEEDRLAQGARLVYTLSATMGIDETPGVTLMELRSRCRRYQKEFGLDMVIIDYLQLMGASSAGKRYESREREISEISMGLKSLAKELKIPIIALAQLNRGPDARPDKRPKMSDLRESGSMEQDADLIAFIYRDEYYNPGSEDTGVAEINIAKNRHGSTASIKLAFLPNFVSFQNLFKEGGQSHAHN